MKIANVETYLVEGVKYNWTLVKVETENGLHGWGEATNWPGSPLVEAACQHVGAFVCGHDARRIDFLWTKIYRDMNWLGQAGPLLSAISAIDIALWDIKGKGLDAPVYELLGGAYRKRIQLYANYWFIEGGHNAEDYARQACEAVAQGFTALKFDRQEFMLKDVPWRDQCLSHRLPIEDGFFILPERPGLGFDVDESVLQAHPGLRLSPAERAFYV